MKEERIKDNGIEFSLRDFFIGGSNLTGTICIGAAMVGGCLLMGECHPELNRHKVTRLNESVKEISHQKYTSSNYFEYPVLENINNLSKISYQ